MKKKKIEIHAKTQIRILRATGLHSLRLPTRAKEFRKCAKTLGTNDQPITNPTWNDRDSHRRTPHFNLSTLQLKKKTNKHNEEKARKAHPTATPRRKKKNPKPKHTRKNREKPSLTRDTTATEYKTKINNGKFETDGGLHARIPRSR